MPPKRKAALAKADSNSRPAKKTAKGARASKPTANKKKADNAAAKPSGGKAMLAPIDNYLLLVHLNNSRNPVITRLLSVPSILTFEALHVVLQVAFGWANGHMYSFAVSKFVEEGERPNQMTGRGEELLTLMDSDSGKEAYPEPERIKKTSDFTLMEIYEGEEYGGKTEVSYEYDHGDGWDHSIRFLGREDGNLRRALHIPASMEVVCLGGEGHPCAEDCGGSGGWEDLKALFKKRNDPDGLKDWYKNGGCQNGDPEGLDPFKWSILDVNDELAKITED